MGSYSHNKEEKFCSIWNNTIVYIRHIKQLIWKNYSISRFKVLRLKSFSRVKQRDEETGDVKHKKREIVKKMQQMKKMI